MFSLIGTYVLPMDDSCWIGLISLSGSSNLICVLSPRVRLALAYFGPCYTMAIANEITISSMTSAGLTISQQELNPAWLAAYASVRQGMHDQAQAAGMISRAVLHRHRGAKDEVLQCMGWKAYGCLCLSYL